MAEFDDKLQSILSNPEIMGQIMSMAGALGQSSPAPAPEPPKQSPPPPGSGAMPFDPGAMMGMMELLKSTQIGQREQNLIRALRGFVPDDRLVRLEKAMQASKVAKFAAGAMQQKQGR